MNILVTGAGGSLGLAVVDHLRQQGFTVTGTDRHAPVGAEDSLVLADLLDEASVRKLVQGQSAVVHLANWANSRLAPALRVFNDNVTMNMNVFESACDAGVGKIIFASSVQVFADDRRRVSDVDQPSCLPYLPLDENMPPRPRNPYALSKTLGEQQLAYEVDRGALASGVALRFPALFTRAVMADDTQRAAYAVLHPQTALDYAFTWLSHQDAASLIEAVLRTDLPGYRCYFAASPVPRSPGAPDELAARYFPDVPVRGRTPLKSLVDLSRITAETGWTPRLVL